MLKISNFCKLAPLDFQPILTLHWWFFIWSNFDSLWLFPSIVSRIIFLKFPRIYISLFESISLIFKQIEYCFFLEKKSNAGCEKVIISMISIKSMIKNDIFKLCCILSLTFIKSPLSVLKVIVNAVSYTHLTLPTKA